MNNIILTVKQFITQQYRKLGQAFVWSVLSLLILIITTVSIGLNHVYADDQYKTAIVFDKNQMIPLFLTDKKTDIQPGLAMVDIDKLNNERDPEAIKAYIQQIAPQYDIDWKLVYAIGAYESGHYKSSLAQNNNNFFGRKATSTTWRSYETVQEGIDDQFVYLKTRYFDKGLDTPAKMNRIYCEGDTWQYKVQFIMDSV